MSEVNKAVAKQSDILEPYFRSGGNLPEADNDINDVNRELVTAYHKEHGQAWLGRINRRSGSDLILWKHEPEEKVYNFGADFVLPEYSAEVADLIEVHRSKATVANLDKLFDLVISFGGHYFLWT